MPPDPTRGLRLGRSFRKTVSIYPRSAPVSSMNGTPMRMKVRMGAFDNLRLICRKTLSHSAVFLKRFLFCNGRYRGDTM